MGVKSIVLTHAANTWRDKNDGSAQVCVSMCLPSSKCSAPRQVNYRYVDYDPILFSTACGQLANTNIATWCYSAVFLRPRKTEDCIDFVVQCLVHWLNDILNEDVAVLQFTNTKISPCKRTKCMTNWRAAWGC